MSMRRQLGAFVNTVSGAGGIARGPVRVQSFLTNTSSNIGLGAGMAPIFHEKRYFAQGIA